MKTIKELGIKLTDTLGGKSYVSNTGAYQKKNNKLYAKLVPPMGSSHTIHGELIRGINCLVHEYSSNGNCNAIEEGDFFDDVKINAFYDKFIDLITCTLPTAIDGTEVRNICDNVRDVIREGARYRTTASSYYRVDNIAKYNLMCDAVIWYVLNTDDAPLPGVFYDRD